MTPEPWEEGTLQTEHESLTEPGDLRLHEHSPQSCSHDAPVLLLPHPEDPNSAPLLTKQAPHHLRSLTPDAITAGTSPPALSL